MVLPFPKWYLVRTIWYVTTEWNWFRPGSKLYLGKSSGFWSHKHNVHIKVSTYIMNFYLLKLKKRIFFRYYFYITPPPTVYNWLAFFQPFHKEIWFAVFSTILVLSGTWYILMIFCPNINEKNKPFDFFIFIFIGLLCQKGMNFFNVVTWIKKMKKKFFSQEVPMNPM